MPEVGNLEVESVARDVCRNSTPDRFKLWQVLAITASGVGLIGLIGAVIALSVAKEHQKEEQSTRANDNDPRLARRIACIGDSLTEGKCSSDSLRNYPSQLQILLDTAYGKYAYNVSNLGKSARAMIKMDNKSYWKHEKYEILTSSQWDIVTIMLGTNDARDDGPIDWERDCGGPGHLTLEGCPFAADYKEFIDVIKTLGTTPAGPKIYVMIPVPLMHQGVYKGLNQTIINSVLPKLLPLIQKNNTGVLGPIDLYSQMGGVIDWQTTFPDSCALDCTWGRTPVDNDNCTVYNESCAVDSSFAPCKWWCDTQNCDQAHPNDAGYARMAKLIQIGLGLDQAIK